MADNNDTQSFAAASSGKSEAEVAFELLNKLKGQGVWGERNIGAILDMYAECLDAAKGLRTYAGQKRVEAPIKVLGAQAPAQGLAPQQPAAQPPAGQTPVPQPMTVQQAMQPAVSPQPVQAQQQALRQALNRG